MEARITIRSTAESLLRELDTDRDGVAVDVDDALAVAKLVRAGEVELTHGQKQSLRERFGSLVDTVLTRLHGFIRYDSREVFVREDLHHLKSRFVTGHEVGHGVLPDHKIVFAQLDDHKRLQPDFADYLEREANQFSIELLAKGDRLRSEFDGSRPSLERLSALGDQLGISKQAVARRVAEESKQECAVAIAWRADKGHGPLLVDRFKYWPSPSFARRFPQGPSREAVVDALRLAGQSLLAPPLIAQDINGATAEIDAEGLDALYSVIVLLVPSSSGRRTLERVFPVRAASV